MWDFRELQPLTRRLGAFRKDTRGQFALWFALLAVPLITMLAYVGDMIYAEKVKAELQGSLDSAALASVINQKLTVAERKAFAKDHFEENFMHSGLFKLDVADASAERVELIASGDIPSHIGAMIGRNEVTLEARSSSELTREDVICMMALDETGRGALRISNESTLVGEDCSIQVNSVHNRAAIVDAGSRAKAKSFCAAGGAVGSYTPYANTECARVEDPYADIPPPSTLGCTALDSLRDGGSYRDLDDNSKEAFLDMVTSFHINQYFSFGNNAVLVPGTYCDPIAFSGKNIHLFPGTYVFRNPLVIERGSSIDAQDVTLALVGPDAAIRIASGSQVTLKAPSTGPYAGLAIYQNAGPGITTPVTEPTARSVLRGGSGMSITGTVYLPTQKLLIKDDSSTSVINQSQKLSPATSFIAHQVSISNSAVRVAVDHKAAGLPPMLPRSDEGARLVH